MTDTSRFKNENFPLCSNNKRKRKVLLLVIRFFTKSRKEAGRRREVGVIKLWKPLTPRGKTIQNNLKWSKQTRWEDINNDGRFSGYIERKLKIRVASIIFWNPWFRQWHLRLLNISWAWCNEIYTVTCNIAGLSYALKIRPRLFEVKSRIVHIFQSLKKASWVKWWEHESNYIRTLFTQL